MRTSELWVEDENATTRYNADEPCYFQLEGCFWKMRGRGSEALAFHKAKVYAPAPSVPGSGKEDGRG